MRKKILLISLITIVLNLFQNVLANSNIQENIIELTKNCSNDFEDVLASFNNLDLDKGIYDTSHSVSPNILNDFQSYNPLIIFFIVFLLVYIVLNIINVIYAVFRLLNKRRDLIKINLHIIRNTSILILFLAFIVLGVYLIPEAFFQTTWDILLESQQSYFPLLLLLIKTSLFVTVFSFIINEIIPPVNKYKRIVPMLLILTILSGLANASVIFIVTSSIQHQLSLKYLLYYYSLAFGIYIAGRRVAQAKQIDLTLNVIYDLITNLIDKLLKTSYRSYEKIDKSRIYATLNHDIGIIGGSSNVLIGMISGFITIIFAFILLFCMSAKMALFVIVILLTVIIAHYLIGRIAEASWAKGREYQGKFYEYVDGIANGFKELSLNNKRRMAFTSDAHSILYKWYKISVNAHIQHLNVALIGESLVIIMLGIVSLLFPILFPEISIAQISSFIIILLYIINPLNNILYSIPQLMQFKIGWNNLQSFLKDIPANLTDSELSAFVSDNDINSYRISNMIFEYDNENKNERFKIGPVNLEIKRGEIMFIAGGNGSGKTTLAKIITGLYKADSGEIFLNNKKIANSEISQCFSVVYSDYYLFKNLFNGNLSDEELDEKSKNILRVLALEDKVNVENGKFSTTKLSSGQRKRLALLNCYIEDHPIYLFDEWAADQDPVFRKYFYEELLVSMKENGKIIFVISHDERYFHVADKIIELDRGEVIKYKDNTVDDNQIKDKK